MKALYVDSDPDRIADLRVNFAKIGFTEREFPLLFCDDFSSMRDFIDRFLLGQQNPLDLIIFGDFEDSKAMENTSRLEVSTWLRNFDGTYSNKNFRIASIPLLIASDDPMIRYWKPDPFVLHQDYHCRSNYSNDNVLGKKVQSLVKGYRRAILDELDNLGLTNKRIEIIHKQRELGYRISEEQAFSLFEQTKILSLDFLLDPRSIKLPWVCRDEVRIHLQNYDGLIQDFPQSRISFTGSNTGKVENQLVHPFFENNYWNLLHSSGKLLGKNLHLKNLSPSADRKSNDYIVDKYVIPHYGEIFPLKQVELKCPDQPIFKNRTKSHPSFSGGVRDGLDAAEDYQESATEHLCEIGQKLGVSLNGVQTVMICGSYDQRMRAEEEFWKSKRLRGYSVEFLTFDEDKERGYEWFEAEEEFHPQ